MNDAVIERLELGLIGCLLANLNEVGPQVAARDAAARGRLFTMWRTKTLWQALEACHKDAAHPHEWELICRLKKTDPKIDQKWPMLSEAITQAENMIPSWRNWPYYADQLLRKAAREESRGTLSEAERALEDEGEDAEVILEGALAKMRQNASLRLQKNTVNKADALNEVMDNMENQSKTGLEGLSTGFEHLDRITKGLRDTELIVFAARPSAGKSVFMMNLAVRLSVRQNIPCLIFSMEMSATSLMRRAMAELTGIPSSRPLSMFSDRDRDVMVEAVGKIAKAPWEFNENNGLSVEEIEAKLAGLIASHGIRCVIVDYLQIIQTKERFEKRHLAVGYVAARLKAMAKRFKIPVVALGQLGRDAENNKPTLTDLKESGDIEQHADIVILVHPTDKDYRKVSPMEAHWLVEKNRNGATGLVRARLIKSTTEWEELSD